MEASTEKTVLNAAKGCQPEIVASRLTPLKKLGGAFDGKNETQEKAEAVGMVL